jgi:hypothetical protein
LLRLRGRHAVHDSHRRHPPPAFCLIGCSSARYLTPSACRETYTSTWRLSVTDEVLTRQCPCRRAFDLGSVLGTWRTRRRSDESKGTRGFTQVQPPRKVKGLRPACLTLY